MAIGLVPRIRSVQGLPVAARIGPAPKEKQMATAVNPYVAEGPVGGSVAFVGRTHATEALVDALEQEHKHVAVLTGLPRSGRTSLLTELAHVVEEQGGMHAVRVELQSRAWDPLDDVISSLADALGRSLRITEPELGHWAENRFAERWLPLLFERIHEDDSLVFLFEEFPVVFDPRSRQAAGAFLPWFAGICEQFPGRIRAVFTTDLRMPDQEAVIRRYFPELQRVEVGPLDLAAAWGLVRLSHLDRSMQWSNPAVERVIALTGAHPLLTQMLCGAVWDRSHRNHTRGVRPEVTIADVENALKDVLEGASSLFETIWSGLTPACRVVAATIAWQDKISAPSNRIAELLHTSGVRVVTRTLENDAPRELRRLGVFQEDSAQLSFQVPLTRRWIRACCPLQDVMRDLDHIDPIAGRLYQEAERIWQTATNEGARRDAIEHLEEVLELNPNHAAATELLSVIFERRGEIDTALNFLDRLHEAQPARARPKLVRLLLQKSQQESNPANRIYLYDRILQVAPGHGEATREKARLSALQPVQPPAAAPNAPSHLPPAVESIRLEPAPNEAQPDLRQPAPGASSPPWSPPATMPADDDRLDRLYRHGLVALEKGDRDSALKHLGKVAVERPTYRETARYLYKAVHDVDPVQRKTEVVSRVHFRRLAAVTTLLAAGLLVSITTRPTPGPQLQMSALSSSPEQEAVLPPEAAAAVPEEATGSANPENPPPPPVAAPAPAASAPRAASKHPASRRSEASSARASALIEKGWDHVESGALTEAEALFDAAVTSDPRSADAHYSLAYVAEKLGGNDTAFIHYCSALQYAGAGTDVDRDVRGRLRELNKSCD